MSEALKTELEKAIKACAIVVEKHAQNDNTVHNTALTAMQYSQAAVNLSNVLIGLEHLELEKAKR